MRSYSKATAQPKLQYVEYLGTESAEGSRKILVLDGQPYYCSTGESSGLPGTWLPFILCRGSMLPYHVTDFHLPGKFQRDAFIDVLQKTTRSERYMIKSSISLITKDNIELTDDQIRQINEILIDHSFERIKNKYLFITKEQMDFSGVTDRFFTKQDLMNSAGLGGGIWENDIVKEKILSIAFSTDEIKKFTNNILLSFNPRIKTKDPDRINMWLISNGAKDLNEIIHSNSKHLKIELYQLVFSNLDCLIEQVSQSNSMLYTSPFFFDRDQDKNDTVYNEIYDFLLGSEIDMLKEIIADGIDDGSTIEVVQNGDACKCIREIINEIDTHDIFERIPDHDEIVSIIENCRKIIDLFKRTIASNNNKDSGNLPKLSK